mgnify:CR=1 FL=1
MNANYWESQVKGFQGFGIYLYSPTFYANLIARASYQESGYISTIPMFNNGYLSLSFGNVANMKPTYEKFGFSVDSTKNVISGNTDKKFVNEMTLATLRATLNSDVHIEGGGNI